MDNSEIETVVHIQISKQIDLGQQIEKKIVDEPDTNPTLDDDNDSGDDQQAIVCYNFLNKNKNTTLNEKQEKSNDITDQTGKNQAQIENQIQPVILQEQQQDDLLDVATRNRKESLEIITNAFNERKLSNLDKYNEYITKRSDYYSQFTSCLIKIQQEASKTIDDAEIFGKQFIKSLKELRQTYKNFSRDLNKITFGSNLQATDRSLWGKIIPNGFKLLLDYQTTCSDTAKVFYQWLDLECIPKVEEIFQTSKVKVESQFKQVKKLKDSYSNLNIKNLLISKQSKNKDLLYQQLKINKLLQDEKNKVQEWGAASSRLLQTIYLRDSEIISMLKFQVSSIIGHLKIINRQSHHLFEAQGYWISIPSDQDSAFNRLLNQWKISDKNIVPKRQLKAEQVHQHLILNNQQKQIGSLKDLIRQLHVNVYKIMVQAQKNQWKPAQAFISIDNNLIIIDDNSSVKNFMNILQVQYNIKQCEVKLKEKEKGLFTTWNRQKIKFSSSNQVQQFTMLIDSMKDLRIQQ